MRRKLVRIGNSLGVTLPPAAIAVLGAHEGETVDVAVEDGHVVIASKASMAQVISAWTPIAQDVEARDLDRMIREDRSSR